MALILSVNLPNDPPDPVAPDIFPVYSALETEYGDTGTRLDILTAIIENDGGLAQTISEADLEEGATSANGMNRIIVDLVAAMDLAADGVIDTADVEAINAEIQGDPDLLAEWTDLHGDDEAGVETGFHTVQNDGAVSRMFGLNAVNTLADGIYHLGFEIDEESGRFVNEDGNLNAPVSGVAEALTYFLGDVSTTGSGLDAIVDAAMTDDGLARRTWAGDIVEGAQAADGMNHIVVDVIAELGLGDDGRISTDDVLALNAHIQGSEALLEAWTRLHGDDEGGVETGFHLIQADGATGQLGGQNLINTVADGLYHLGFAIDPATQRFENEDGNLNAATGQVATWLNHFLYDLDAVYGTAVADRLVGADIAEEMFGEDGNDAIFADDGNDTVDGGAGNDTVRGWFGDDRIDGGSGNDRIGADAGADTITGGAGRDVMDAGFDDDADIFVFAPGDTGITGDTIDVVRNFDPSDEDLIDLTAFGGLVFVEDGNFTDIGQVSFVDGFVLLNLDEGSSGDRIADAAIRVESAEILDAADFLL